jgi:CMP-N-acetylneuraminic acid synthetase
MIRGVPLTSIIPVRGGSKGIPRKNLYRLNGKTLLERAIELSQHSRWVDNVYVTTEDPEMYAIAQRYGAAAPTLRPAELATDDAHTIDVVLHLIKTVPVLNGYLLLQQASSPLCTVDDLDSLCQTFEKCPDAEAIVSVVQHTGPHPDKILTMKGDYLRSYMGTNVNVPRQTLPSVYAINGAFKLISLESVVRQGNFLPERTIPYIMPPERSIDLDTTLDLVLMEAVLEKGLVQLESIKNK